MKFLSITLTYLFLQSTQAARLSEDDPLTILEARDSFGSTINWAPCKLGIDSKLESKVTCARLSVPLDYTGKYNDGTILLDLIRVKATKESFKGSIIMNPGGPGASGVEFVLREGHRLAKVVGGYHDIIGFDTR